MAENNQVATTEPVKLNAFLKSEGVQNRIKELVKDNAPAFTTSLLQIVNSSDMLKNAEPQSLLMAALTAATLNLPLNNSTGFAWIVPFYNNSKKITEAQFQISAKGFKQLALRSGQFKFLNSTDVRMGELKKHNRLSGEMEFEWIQDEETRASTPVIGYVSYFELLNGFSQSFYMTIHDLTAHAKKYSQTFKSDKKWVVESSRWTVDFPAMALKTVTKLNLSKNAPLSVDMQKAIQADQAVVTETEDGEFVYMDNQNEEKSLPKSLMQNSENY